MQVGLGAKKKIDDDAVRVPLILSLRENGERTTRSRGRATRLVMNAHHYECSYGVLCHQRCAQMSGACKIWPHKTIWPHSLLAEQPEILWTNGSIDKPNRIRSFSYVHIDTCSAVGNSIFSSHIRPLCYYNVALLNYFFAYLSSFSLAFQWT